MHRGDDLDPNALSLLRAAVALAATHFPLSTRDGVTNVSSRDAAFLLDGHVDVWPAWIGLGEQDADRVVRLLRARRAEYADGEWARRELRRALDHDALPAMSLVADTDEDLTIAFAPGMGARAYVDEVLDDLERKSTIGRGSTPTAGPGGHHTTLRSHDRQGATRIVDQRVTIPARAVGAADAVAPRLSTSLAIGEITVPAEELIAFAEKIDGARGGAGYRARHVSKLFERLQSVEGPVSPQGALFLPSGETRLMNAPTGVGKSVLLEVLACWAALHDLVVTLVVPTNADVLKLAHAVEQDLDALGSPARATPLMSPSSMFESVRKAVRARASWDPDARWTLERLGYGCALAAGGHTDAQVDPWAPGREPCTSLQPDDEGSRGPRACPWRGTCAKFRLARAALDAAVIVTSHANFHSGRAHLPMRDERGLSDRTTVEELVLRRSHLVVIDEIDAFQDNVVAQAARGIELDRRGCTETPLHQLEREFVRAAGRINRDVESSVRRMVHHSKYLASLYTSAVHFGAIGAESSTRVGAARYWIVPRRWDGLLTARLHGLTENEPLTAPMLEAFRSLFPGTTPSATGEPADFPAIRHVLAGVTQVGAEDSSLEDSREALDALLRERIAEDQERASTVDKMLRRAILESLRLQLRKFVYDAPHLSGAGVPAAQTIAETFGSYSRWRAMPNGPLGRLLLAFSQHHDPSGQRPVELRAAAFGGDPHAYTTTIADITALCRAGTRRVVLGLSATAFFPQAPRHHVHLDPHWWVADEDGGVRVLPAYITRNEPDGARLVRVSGTQGVKRQEAMQQLASGLWRSRLRSELVRLAEQEPERQLVLLATTSYEGARHAAQGLIDAGVRPRDICLAVQPQIAPGAVPDPSDDASMVELAADRLEDVPTLGVRILIAPLARVQRGVNIIGAQDRSALGSIWLLVRPIPIIDEPAELVAHVNAFPLAPDASDPLLRDLPIRPADVLQDRKQSAGRHFEDIVSAYPYFRTMPPVVQLSVTAEIMNGLIQLVGRARRGGTPAVVHLVDGALLDPAAGPTFGSLVARLREHWADTGQLERMHQLYGTTLAEFFRYADAEATLHQ